VGGDDVENAGIADEAVLWSCDEAAEELTHTCPEDAVEALMEDRCEVGMTLEQERALYVGTLTAYGYARRVVDDTHVQRIAECALEDALERLDEEYGGEEDV
jgi:hypothetical protein